MRGELAFLKLQRAKRDPAERLTAVTAHQARHDGVTLVTPDSRLHAYDVAVIDPRD